MISAAVNLLFCVPGEVGGSEEYLVRQLAGLAGNRSATDVELAVHASPAFFRAHPDIPGRRVPSPLDAGNRPMRVLMEHTWLAARTRGADVVHHGGGTTPAVGTRPTVLTMHDLQFLTFPQYVRTTKLRYLRWMVPRSIGRATVVTTPSEYVRTTVIDAYGVDPARVLVVPHGVPQPDPAMLPSAATTRSRYGLGDGPVLVYPAITHPHKNHAVLLDAMARWWTETDLRLVLLGGRGGADDAVERRIAELGLSHRVVRPGRVPAADRDAIIGLAEVLLFPSRYEGFGAPLVEAMALGTPIVAGDHPAIVEVVGEAAVVVPTDDADAWGTALDAARRRRHELVAAGRRRCGSFTIATAGAALETAYRTAVASCA